MRRGGHVAAASSGWRSLPARSGTGISYFTVIKRFNEQTKYGDGEVGDELDPLSAAHRSCATSSSASGTTRWTAAWSPAVMKTFYKVNASSCYKSYEQKMQPLPATRCSTARSSGAVPAHYYANFSNWLAERLGHRRPGGDGEPELHQAA